MTIVARAHALAAAAHKGQVHEGSPVFEHLHATSGRVSRPWSAT